MFESLFRRPHALARHRNGPLADERRRYLVHCADRGMKIPTLLVVAFYLLVITKYLRLDKRDNRMVSLAEVEAAANRLSETGSAVSRNVLNRSRAFMAWSSID